MDPRYCGGGFLVERVMWGQHEPPIISYSSMTVYKLPFDSTAANDGSWPVIPVAGPLTIGVNEYDERQVTS